MQNVILMVDSAETRKPYERFLKNCSSSWEAYRHLYGNRMRDVRAKQSVDCTVYVHIALRLSSDSLFLAAGG
jgi:hypothetical protein